MVTQGKMLTLVQFSIVPILMTGCEFGNNQQFFENTAVTSAAITNSDPGAGDPGAGTGGSATPTATPILGGGVGGGAGGGSSGTPTPSPVAAAPTATPTNTAMATDTFSAAVSQVKKIDFLFVVDNSGSMADNQAKLAQGFQVFANTFYHRTDLDICTLIITSDRYLGATGAGGYSRERNLPCTKPAGSESWTAAQMQSHMDDVVAAFMMAVDVGTHGSGTELLGKSVQAFLSGSGSSFFRQDAVANITFITDENNYFFGGNSVEASNDLPAIRNNQIFNAAPGTFDNRIGIKDMLDGFFTGIRPGVGLSYSTTTFLELAQPATTIPGISMNLDPLSGLIGRNSTTSDIEGAASDYASVYQSISSSLVDRANAFHLTHDLYEPSYPTLADLVVTLASASGSSTVLNAGTDYTVNFPNDIALNAAVASTTSAGDQITVTYRYQLP